jgi:large subunit ribosomal protein L13
MSTKTIEARSLDIEPKWYLIDAKNQVLGKLAVEVAGILRGKNKPYYQQDVDMGDFVVIINADKFKVSGNKRSEKLYYHHTGYIGGLRSKSLEKKMEKSPEFPVWHAIRGMLPKNRLGRKMLKKVKIYTGDTHPHKAQKPILIENK